MTIASDLFQRHIQTLVDDNTQWQTLIADDVLWELAYAPSIGHPAQLAGREEAVRHAIWFVGAVGTSASSNSTCMSEPIGNMQSPKQGGGAHQVYGTYVLPELYAISACSRRQDRVHSTIF